MSEKIPVAIIGGGITGLSAAWELQTNYPDQPYIVFESSKRWGGKVITKRLSEPQAVIDGGPESFVTRKPDVWDLAHELHIESQIIVPASETRGMNVLHQGRIYSIPLHPFKFLQSTLLSWRAKLRLLAEPFIAARRDAVDETLAEFVQRRLGSEVLEKLIGPVLGGIYNADPTTQSILYTAPVMRDMEREHGSLFWGSLARMRARKKSQTVPKPAFIAFKHGAQTLIDALVAQLTGDLRLSSPVLRIEPLGSQYSILLSDGTSILVGGVLLATSASVASNLLEKFVPDVAADLAAIRQSSLGTMSLLYHNADLPPTEINGLLIPRSEKRMIDAVQFTSKRITNRTDAAHSLIRVFFGGANPQMVNYDDVQRLHHIQAELHDLLHVTAVPIAYESFCWQANYPQADVGHLDRVSAIEAALTETLAIAGASYRGLGVPDCIRQGREAAKRVANVLKTHTINLPTYA
jgi:oxygen-dependent protoporphyrinogen oxidase